MQTRRQGLFSFPPQLIIQANNSAGNERVMQEARKGRAKAGVAVFFFALMPLVLLCNFQPIKHSIKCVSFLRGFSFSVFGGKISPRCWWRLMATSVAMTTGVTGRAPV